MTVKEYDKKGYQKAMEKWAEILSERFITAPINAFMVALYYNRAGKYEEAIKWLETGYEIHDVNMPYAFVAKEFDPIRSDPRFIAIANKMGLPYKRNSTKK